MRSYYLKFLILMLTGGILLLAMNQSFINKIKFEKYFSHLNQADTSKPRFYRALFLSSDRWRYGDLYGIAYLPQYKFKLEPFKVYKKPPASPVTNRILYIIGDSFLADKVLSGAFENFDDVIFLDRRFAFGPLTIDSLKQNYLIMEFAERNLNNYDISKTQEALWTTNQIRHGSAFRKDHPPGANSFKEASIPERVSNILFNKDLSRNLELLLFDNQFSTPFKEARASLNYACFGRVATEVAVSTKKDRLFLNLTVDTGLFTSSFRIKPDNAVTRITQNLDKAASYYKAIGFKNVFLSVIPNSVSVYDKDRMPYNHLAERVEKHTGLKVIPLYQLFLTSKQNLFYRSDAHWNPAGLDCWVKQANKILNDNLN